MPAMPCPQCGNLTDVGPVCVDCYDENVRAEEAYWAERSAEFEAKMLAADKRDAERYNASLLESEEENAQNSCDRG